MGFNRRRTKLFMLLISLTVILMFSTQAYAACAPTVETYAASNINQTSATLKGKINTNGGVKVTEYGFYWGTSPNPTTKKVVGKSISTPASLSTNISKLTPGTTYYYKSYAKNSVDTSFGSVISFTTSVKKPTAPTLSKPTVISSSEIKLTWKTVTGATSYNIYRATSSNGSYTKIGNSTTNSFTDTCLNAATKYYYKVKAANSAGESNYSNGTSATTKISQEKEEAKRAKIIQNAIAMKNATWTPAQDLKGWRSRITYKKGTKYTGLPYSQNIRVNQDDFINKLTTDKNFYKTVGKGKNAMPKYGIDCSGYVCKAWEVKLTNSTGLRNAYVKKDFKDIKKGDALVKPGVHAMLFEKIDTTDANKIWVYEQGDWNDPKDYPQALKNGGDFSGPKYHTKDLQKLKKNGYIVVSLFK